MVGDGSGAETATYRRVDDHGLGVQFVMWKVRVVADFLVCQPSFAGRARKPYTSRLLAGISPPQATSPTERQEHGNGPCTFSYPILE